MKVSTNSHLLSSLVSLIDPNQRGQQQALQEQQDNRQKQTQETASQTPKVARQDKIDANRDALRKLQERLKTDKLEKLKTELSLEKIDDRNKTGGVNLNLRESFGNGNRPANTRPGQIIDIRV
ncbi:MAG: hypothetical protein JKY45_11260 [Emcibacter sp.]|nr:hypothetical protein [Emcibacter sp.]